jgi:hypothetical protein
MKKQGFVSLQTLDQVKLFSTTVIMKDCSKIAELIIN